MSYQETVVTVSCFIATPIERINVMVSTLRIPLKSFLAAGSVAKFIDSERFWPDT
jgi:hypothetical protein